MAGIASIANGRIVLPDSILDGHSVVVEDGKIVAIESGATKGETIDAAGGYIAPGFIDLHTHGGFGVDLSACDPQGVREYGTRVPATGVTSYLPTIAAVPTDELKQRVAVVVEHATHNNAEVLGVHLEGPSLNPERPGCFDKEMLLDARTTGDIIGDIECVRMVTLAPELDGARELISELSSRGIVCAAGHTTATYEQMMDAFENGVTHVTHLFNAMRPFHHRDPGAIAAALVHEGVTVQLIVDGIHLHPGTVTLAVRAKGIDGVVLVTDAIAATGLGDGTYYLGGVEATVTNGVSRVASGAIAGSTLAMNLAVDNLIKFTNVSLPEAVRTASLTPATVIGIDDRKGSIEVGKHADIIIFDEHLVVGTAMVGGAIVYRS